MTPQDYGDKPERLKFVHRFGAGILAELEVDAQPPETEPEPGRINITWTGRPKKKHVQEYRQWVLYSMQIVIDRWQKSLIYLLGVSPRQTEVWHFLPGQAPKLIEKLPYGIE